MGKGRKREKEEDRGSKCEIRKNPIQILNIRFRFIASAVKSAGRFWVSMATIVNKKNL